MKHIKLTGDYYSIGVQYGKILKRSGFIPPPASDEKLEFVKQCENIIANYSPDILTELQGISDGGKFDSHLINSLILTLDGSPSCTVFAISGKFTNNGKTIFARNYDYFRSFEKYSELYQTSVTGVFRSIGCSDIFVGREDGVNEHGLAIGETYVGYEYRKPGFIFPLVVRSILDKCRNVDEATEFITHIPHQRNVNFLLADKQGKIVIAESASGRVKITECNDIGIITNQFTSKEMVNLQPPQSISKSSLNRLSNFHTWFNSLQKPVSCDEVRKFLLDPKRGICQIDDNYSDWKEPICTLWSWAAELGIPKIHLTDKLSQNSSYEKITI